MATSFHKSYRLGDFELEPDLKRLSLNGQSVHIANRPFQVLLYLIENNDRLVSRNELLDKFWDGRDVYDDALRKAVGTIRKTLNDHHDHPQFIETRWAGGYRYIGPIEEFTYQNGPSVVEIERTRGVKITVEETKEDYVDVAKESKVSSLALSQPKPKLSRFALISIVAIVVLFSGAAIFFIKQIRTQQPTQNDSVSVMPVHSIAILPLKNLTGDVNKDFLCDGMTESLISPFSKYKDLKVISRTSAFAFKNKDVTPQEVGQKLGVEGILEGSMKMNGDKLYVDVRLVSTKDGRVIWTSQTFERPSENAFEIQDGVACAVSTELKVRLCGESELNKSNTKNADAYEAYLKGRYHWHKRTPEDMKAALNYFERAVKLDPNYALGYAGLADTYTVMEVNNQVPPRTAAPKAREFAMKVLSLDDSLAGPYAALGLLTSNSDWNWKEGEKFYKESLARNSGYATAHHWYGYSLMMQRRFEEAEREMKRAEELDPLAYGISNTLSELYCHWRQYDKCLEQSQAALKLLPNNWNSLRLISLSYWHRGMKAEAIKALDEGKLQLQKEILTNENREEVRRKIEEYAKSQEGVNAPYIVASYYAAFGDKEATFIWLQKAYNIHQADLVSLNIEPNFDFIRDDPRYIELIRKMGLSD
jgi:TolB-like protein/DNA-binding winged helix-turn-helix (wHTH) protein